ncbi:hypothetical protein JM93_02889 [Roseibium hamelinense]|uniref:Secreted protein n=1 Tax=Roseibium hamelinense TaxID=150831 RepID=A0A562SXZ2_9HYPH|nr:hypothetical protein [Roseibium hamelinense]MTI43664.1 hypothetical protein [Roseibium hamelinense]TWI86181.1 hypothetical protein JM93_02889 [Roseibium hamelinense]
MTWMKCAAGFAALASVASFSTAASATDFYDRLARSQEIRENAERGGPQVQGANSPLMLRVKVCKDLPLEVVDKNTGKRTTETRKQCWFE